MAVYEAKQFSVDSDGAYLVDLYDNEGRPVLYPRTIIDGKRRGGAHVCLPYFGADAACVLSQHGFGRDVEWRAERLSDQVVECSYSHNEDDMFSGLEVKLRYELEADNRFSTTLVIANSGDKPFAVSPGFHPYFTVNPTNVRLNGDNINLIDFEPYRDYPDTESVTIESDERIISVASENLTHMVAWTNLQANFFCVEPTHSGHSFDSSELSGAVLGGGDEITYSYAINWS